MLERLSDELPQDSVVLGNPFNGSTLVYAIADREVVFPYYAGVWSEDAAYLGRHFASGGPEVCAAIDRLGVDYFYFDRQLYGGWSELHRAYDGLNAVPRDDVQLTPVASAGTTTLYRVDGCG